MFETSFGLFIQAGLSNILVPLIPGILFLRIFFGKRWKGIMLYLLALFIGTGVVAFTLFNIQFFHYGIGMGEYIRILIVLLVIYIIKVLYKKESRKDYLNTLKISIPIPEIKTSYHGLSKIQKILGLGGGILALGILVLSFVRVTNLPTYADDSFGNWNGPALNIYHDEGIKLFGEKTEILGRGRLGYPVYIPIYKTLISDFMGGFNDIYINLRQWLIFLGLVLFVIKITRDKTKNIFYSILPAALICGLPLVFFHAGEGYMELASAAYSVLAIRAFWKFLEDKEYGNIALAILLISILAQIKNDGFVVYMPGILIGFLIVLALQKRVGEFFRGLFQDKKNLLASIGYVVYFMLPFLLIRMINQIGLNPVATNDGGLGVTKIAHWEIFTQFTPIFMRMDNYNVILGIIFILLIICIKKIKRKDNNIMLLLSGGLILLIFILAFLFTENYVFVMNQTTINRVLTMCFIVIVSFIGILIYDNEPKESGVVLNK